MDDSGTSVTMSLKRQGFVQGHEENHNFEGKHHSPCKGKLWGHNEIRKLERGAQGNILLALANNILDIISTTDKSRSLRMLRNREKTTF